MILKSSLLNSCRPGGWRIQKRGSRTLIEVLLGVLVCIGAATGQDATKTSSPPLSPPGELIDLGGWRVHLHCTGPVVAAQPTVILEAGAGAFSVDWSLVQPPVSRFARVCSYDRAGLGWSELGPRPRTLHQIVWELHTLLDKARIAPPYIFVGHSYGGILSRRYAFTYPSEVVGMVLVDSGHERGVAVFRDGRMVPVVELASGRPIPPVKTGNPLREDNIPATILGQIEASARQMVVHATEPPYDKLPKDAKRMRSWAFGQVKQWAANDNPFEGDELKELLAEEEKRENPLRKMPLIVLSRGMPEGNGPEAKATEDEHNKNQKELVALSSTGKQVMAPESGHEIMISQPDLVITAIRDLLAKSRN